MESKQSKAERSGGKDRGGGGGGGGVSFLLGLLDFCGILCSSNQFESIQTEFDFFFLSCLSFPGGR